ncbi:MAG: hypothetical protein WDN69_03955 [Aliidongia sp.]
MLRLLIRALGRIRAGDEARYVVKLSSWNVRLLALFRQAFPDVPWIWVHRAPAEGDGRRSWPDRPAGCSCAGSR